MQRRLTLFSSLCFFYLFLFGTTSFLPPMKMDIFISKYSFMYFAYMDSTRLYWQFGTGVSRLDSLTCSVSRVDMCHQAIDHEEEEEDEENCEQIFVHSFISKTSSHHHTWCIPLWHFKRQQQLVILVNTTNWTTCLQVVRVQVQQHVLR